MSMALHRVVEEGDSNTNSNDFFCSLSFMYFCVDCFYIGTGAGDLQDALEKWRTSTEATDSSVARVLGLESTAAAGNDGGEARRSSASSKVRERERERRESDKGRRRIYSVLTLCIITIGLNRCRRGSTHSAHSRSTPTIPCTLTH